MEVVLAPAGTGLAFAALGFVAVLANTFFAMVASASAGRPKMERDNVGASAKITRILAEGLNFSSPGRNLTGRARTDGGNRGPEWSGSTRRFWWSDVRLGTKPPLRNSSRAT